MLNLNCQDSDLCLESSLGSKATVKHEGHKLSECENLHTAGFLLRSHLLYVDTGAWEQQIYFVMPSTPYAVHSSPYKCIKKTPKLFATLMYSVTTTSVHTKQLIPPTLKAAGNTKLRFREASWENEEHKALSRYWREMQIAGLMQLNTDFLHISDL